ncbi:hypothetical protein [Blastococcus sp. PRF04-17]|uniref:hypothetical protein n=1 Tax=Blastococcus sp. PRF04-17 TaxID=2933797 RepID=UPI001FF36141|nr:hypothetical protein [Blastococcus sp. PRF04-17]UOY03328.1 hypothetical protein MVA48_08295 [Blastococcus sp. PRF04-17]
MTWGVIVDVPAPVEVYDAMHARLLERTGGSVEGLLVHLARETGSGFQIVEVWESQAAYERSTTEIVGPIARELTGDAPPPSSADTARTFEVRGLVLPRAQIAV